MKKNTRENTLNFILEVGGGLGDIIAMTLLGDRMSKFKQLINKHLDRYFKLLIICHNPEAQEMFRGQKWIDEVKQVEYTHTNAPYLNEYIGYIKVTDDMVVNVFDVGDQFKMWLNKDEQANLNELTKEPFTLIHPHGGQKHKDFTPEILEHIRKETKGKKVYVLGRNYDRVSHSQEVNPFPNEWISQIDKLNIRETIELIQHPNCEYVYATHSSILMTAWIYNKPNTCYYPTNCEVDELIFNGKVNFYNFAMGRENTKLIPIVREKGVNNE